MTNSIYYLADALLGQCPKDKSAPHYTETGFKLKLISAHRREAYLPTPRREPALEYLFRREWQGLMRAARLTYRQREVMRNRLNGWTFQEIGDVGGHSKQSSEQVYRAAIKKIARVLGVYRFSGLCETYRIETSRGRKQSAKGRMVR